MASDAQSVVAFGRGRNRFFVQSRKFPQLTLFPRFSKSFEADLGYILAFFGKHLLKQ